MPVAATEEFVNCTIAKLTSVDEDQKHVSVQATF